MKDFLWKYTLVFVVFFIVTFEFEYSVIPNLYQLLNPFFENLVYWSGTLLFDLKVDFNPVISSDSIGLYVHTFNLIIISVLLAFIWAMLFKTSIKNIRQLTLKIITYYLSLQMLLYGLNKVFKLQFYKPASNLLFTNLGDLTPDILYWSTIGSSWSYSFFLGLTEVIVACFLLFKKTRLLGVLVGIVVMVNVVLINFSYDISVKLYAAFLLSLFLVLIVPYLNYLYASLVLQKPIALNLENEKVFGFIPNNYKAGIKVIVIFLFLMEGLYPSYKANIYNGDKSKQRIFTGAYKVVDAINKSSDYNWKQVFIHKDGYFISKSEDDKMQDYQLEVDTVNQILSIVRYDLNKKYTLNYELKNNKLHHVFGVIGKSNIDFYLHQIDEKTIPLLNASFHWTTNHLSQSKTKSNSPLVEE